MFNKEARNLSDLQAMRADRSFGGFQRNFTPVWQKFQQYSEENTIMVSNYFNAIDDYHRNDLVLPLYDPKMGKTDFLDDKHLAWTYNYLGFLASLES